MFEENQYVSLMHSFGPQGAIMPYATSSDNWKSLVDADGKGILCFFDEFYDAEYWTFAGAKDGSKDVTDYYYLIINEVRFRPRQIKNNDLMRIMIQRQCSRPCNIDPSPNLWPKCETNCPVDKGFNAKELKDDEEGYDLNGDKLKGKELNKHWTQREGFKTPCVPVCETSGKTPPAKQVNFALLFLGKYKEMDSLLTTLVVDGDSKWNHEYIVSEHELFVQVLGPKIKFYDVYDPDDATLIKFLQQLQKDAHTIIESVVEYQSPGPVPPKGDFNYNYLYWPRARPKDSPKYLITCLFFNWMNCMLQGYRNMQNGLKGDYGPWFSDPANQPYFGPEKFAYQMCLNTADPVSFNEFCVLLSYNFGSILTVYPGILTHLG